MWPVRVFAEMEEEEEYEEEEEEEGGDEERAAMAGGASPHNSGLPTITEIAVQSAELCQEMVDGKEKSFMGYTFICKARDERWTVSD